MNHDEWEILDTLLISLGSIIRTNVFYAFPYIPEITGSGKHLLWQMIWACFDIYDQSQD